MLIHKIYLQNIPNIDPQHSLKIQLMVHLSRLIGIFLLAKYPEIGSLEEVANRLSQESKNNIIIEENNSLKFITPNDKIHSYLADIYNEYGDAIIESKSL